MMTQNIRTRDEIAESQRICRLAYPPPWYSLMAIDNDGNGDLCANDPDTFRMAEFHAPMADENREFCAHARTALPLRNAQVLTLLDERKRLLNIALDFGGHQSWRCEHPDRYGTPCKCGWDEEQEKLRAELAALERDGE